MIYNCYRCNYTTERKGSFVSHLNRKYICKPILCDMSIEEMKEHYKLHKTKSNEEKKTEQKEKKTENKKKEEDDEEELEEVKKYMNEDMEEMFNDIVKENNDEEWEKKQKWDKIEEICEKGTTTINKTISVNSNKTNNVNVHINNYGKNLSYVNEILQNIVNNISTVMDDIAKGVNLSKLYGVPWVILKENKEINQVDIIIDILEGHQIEKILTRAKNQEESKMEESKMEESKTEEIEREENEEEENEEEESDTEDEHLKDHVKEYIRYYVSPCYLPVINIDVLK